MNKMGENKIMKKYKGVIFFDYDGTTVDEVDEIKTATPTTVESLNKLKENGYLTMLCSGRTQRFLEMDIDKFMGAITCNGSHTEVEGEVIRDICIPDELVFQVVNISQEIRSFILRQEISVIIYIWMKSFSKITANFLICHNDGMRHGNSAQKTLTSANLL